MKKSKLRGLVLPGEPIKTSVLTTRGRAAPKPVCLLTMMSSSSLSSSSRSKGEPRRERPERTHGRQPPHEAEEGTFLEAGSTAGSLPQWVGLLARANFLKRRPVAAGKEEEWEIVS